MVFTPDDLDGIDESLARRVILVARTIAPCLDTLDGDAKKDAQAILLAVAAEGRARGSRHIAGQRLNSAWVDYRDVSSWFFDDDRAALRSLCGAMKSPSTPVGQFPRSTSILGTWPEENVRTD